MKALTFRLYGKFACFRKPDVNSEIYFTYNNIHKVVLLGIFGSILGFGGYNEQKDLPYPEFYEKLHDIKVSIVPENKGIFSKKIQTFTNTVGYASREEGRTLIVREQWIENPSWKIYVLEGHKEYKNLSVSLMNKKSIYIPYLGKNDHLANFSNIEEINLDSRKGNFLHSLTKMADIKLGKETYNEYENSFLFKEVAPIGLTKKYNMYEFEELIYTNYEIKNIDKLSNIYSIENNNIQFI